MERSSQRRRLGETRLTGTDSFTSVRADFSARVMEEKAFIEELRRANGPMRAMILSITNSPSDLDDILQETSRALWQRISDYDPEKAFLPWALAFARMQSLAYLKSKGREDRKLQSFAIDAIEAALTRRNVTEEGALFHHLRICVRKLTERQRDLLHRRYHLGYSIREIATLEGGDRSREAFYKTFQRMHQSLLDCMNRQKSLESE